MLQTRQDSSKNRQPPTVNEYDYLIVGQGLAGSIVAWLLIRDGRRVIIADSQPDLAASQTSAGIIDHCYAKLVHGAATAAFRGNPPFVEDGGNHAIGFVRETN